MSAPELTRRLVLEVPVRVADGAGGFVTGWEARGVLYGAVAPRKGRMVRQGAARISRQPLRITLRGAPLGSPRRPEPGQRLCDGARVYAVLAVTEADARGLFLTVEAEEEIAA